LKSVPSSLRTVQAFGAVARAGSVVGAAGELAVSPSALSHLIRQLERRVGVALFVRAGRGLKLTTDGEQLAAAVVPALATISEALSGFARRGTEARMAAGPRAQPASRRLSAVVDSRNGGARATRQRCRMTKR
jgi:LysR family transcriptional regulator, glycine cleavage system transcriptional activator